MTYIVPIVYHVLRRGSGQGIQAVVVYPMNALANSQAEELKKFLEKGYGHGKSPVSFERYTGQEKGDEREGIRNNPPDILLTNYMMLELLLTRREDRALVKAAQGLRYLVFDELHTYPTTLVQATSRSRDWGSGRPTPIERRMVDAVC